MISELNKTLLFASTDSHAPTIFATIYRKHGSRVKGDVSEADIRELIESAPVATEERPPVFSPALLLNSEQRY